MHPRRSTTDLLEEYSRIFGLVFEEYALRVREILDELRRRGAFGGTEATSSTKVAELTPPLHERWNKSLNKFLAHPTERRYTTPRSWPVEEMRDAMRELIAVWRQAWNEPLEWKTVT